MYTVTIDDLVFFRNQTNDIIRESLSAYARPDNFHDWVELHSSYSHLSNLFNLLDQINADNNELVNNTYRLTYPDQGWLDMAHNYTARLYVAWEPKKCPLKNIKRMPLVEKTLLQQTRKKSLKVEVFTAESDNTLYCITNGMLEQEQLIFLKLMQYNLFKENFKNFKEETIDFLKGILNRSLPETNSALAKLIEPKTIKKAILQKTTLTRILNSKNKRTLQRLEQEIAELDHVLLDYYNAYMSRKKRLSEKKEAYQLLSTNKGQEIDPTDLINYLINHPYIEKLKINENSLILQYIAPILFYSTAKAQNVKFGRSTKENQIIDIFLSDKYTLWTVSEVKINLQDFSIHSSESFERHPNYIKHPHIMEYGCFGTHLDDAIEYQKNNNYIGLIDQITGAVNELNFSDVTVISNLLRVLRHAPEETWEKKETGEMMTTNQVLEELENGKTTDES